MEHCIVPGCSLYAFKQRPPMCRGHYWLARDNYPPPPRHLKERPPKQREDRPATKSDRVRALLAERYACGEIPTGELTVVANEVGVTRELVRQLARKGGYTRLYKQPTPRLCECGGTLQKGRKWCENCLLIPVACDVCGKVVRRPRAAILRSVSDHRYKGRQFCSKTCVGVFAGSNYGWGNPNHPIHSRQS